MEDEYENATTLHLYNQGSETACAARDNLVEGQVILVKEPYFTHDEDCGYVIRVDHVTDLVHLLPGNKLIPAVWRRDDKRSVDELLREAWVMMGKGELGKGLIW